MKPFLHILFGIVAIAIGGWAFGAMGVIWALVLVVWEYTLYLRDVENTACLRKNVSDRNNDELVKLIRRVQDDDV